MQMVKIVSNWFVDGAIEYVAGEMYAVSDSTTRQVDIGNGEMVEVPKAPDEVVAKSKSR